MAKVAKVKQPFGTPTQPPDLVLFADIVADISGIRLDSSLAHLTNFHLSVLTFKSLQGQAGDAKTDEVAPVVRDEPDAVGATAVSRVDVPRTTA